MARLNGARLLMLEKEKDVVVRTIPVRTGPVQIGRNPTLNTIRLNSAGVEDIHCKIFVKNDKVFIANYSASNPISVDKTVVPKRAALNDGSILEICGTRFRWKVDDSKLAATGRPEKTKKAEQTPTSSKFGSRRRTTMVRKKQLVATAAAAAGGSGKKVAAKKITQQKTPTYTLPKNHKQLLKNIRKRFTVHNIMTRHNSQDDADEDDADGEDSALVEVAESAKPATPQKSSSTSSSAANTPFYTPEPEKENSVPVTKTPKTPMLQLENSAMMILSYTPAIGSRSKANIQKTPISAAKNTQRLNYLTPKNENVSASETPLKSKAGNSMYLIDLTSPNSGHSSFVCSPMLDMTASSIGSPKTRLIDLTTPSPVNAKTPASVMKSTQQKTLLKSALKNASRTPRTALRTVTGTPVTPKAVPKISLNDTPNKSAVSTRSNKTPASGSKGSSIRSKLETPISSKKIDSARKQTAPATPTVTLSTPQKEVPIMTTDELFDTLVGRQSNVKTYERKSTSPKKTPCPLVVAEDTDLPKTDIDLWVESVVAAVTSPEPVNIDAIIRKPNQTTQVRSSQYSDITPHESFAETAGTSEVVDTQTEVAPTSSPDELHNMTDKPTIPNSSRRSETPLANKIARSLGNKRQTIGNFFTNIFGKLTVSPVTRISIADGSLNQSEGQEPTNGDDSDGSEEVYHDSETDHAGDVPQTTDESAVSSPKLRQSLRDTRKFIGNAWTSLNTSRPQLDNTVEIDESLLLSDTYNESQTDAGNNTVDDDYDLTDLGSRPATAQPPVSAARTPSLRRSVQSFEISPLATPLESTPNKTVPPQDLERDVTGSFVISPDATLPGTPVSRRSQASTSAKKNVVAATSTMTESTPSRRSSRRQTIQQADSNSTFNESTAVPTEETENVEDIAKKQSSSEIAPDQLEQPTCHLSENSLNADVVNEQGEEQISSQDVTVTSGLELVVNGQVEESAVETLHEEIPAKGEIKTIDEEQPDEIAISANSTALETSEMEPLEVTDSHESASEVAQPATPSKDLVGGKRATRNSIVTFQVVTPKSASPAAKVPTSESNLSLRGLRRKADEANEELAQSPEGADSFRELLEDSNKSMDPIVEVGNQSVVEQSTEIEKTTTSCDDQAKVINYEAELKETITPKEFSLSEDHVATALESSQTTVYPDFETVEDTAVQISTENLEISNFNVAARRSTRKSFASMTITPKTAAASLSKVPMSESKLPLRGLRKTMVEASERSPDKKRGADSIREVELLEESDLGKEDKPIDQIKESTDGSVVEQSMTSYDDQVEVVRPELNEITTHDEASRSEDLVTSRLESSQTTAEPGLDTVEDTATVLDSTAKLETSNLNVVARRSTRKSLATVTTTPKTTASSLSKVPMSESKLPLRQLKTIESSILEQTVEEDPALDENSIAVDSEPISVTLERSVNKSVELGTPKTSTTTQSAKSTPIPASPSLPSRSSARSTPPKPSNTPSSKSTPSSTAPLLKRVLQKVVKASATKAAVAQSPKPNDSVADASLQLDQLYQTPTPRVTRGKVATSTPNVADESLKLDELYKTPARVTRGNATPAGKVNNDESLASSSLHLDNLYSTPVHSVALEEDSEVALENSLESSSVDKSLNLTEQYTTPAKALRDESQLSEVPETPMESASPKVEADMSLNLQQMYKTPARANAEQLEAKNAEIHNVTETSLNQEEMCKTPARSATSCDTTPARSTRHSAAVSAEPQQTADVSLNLMELYKTPAALPTRSAAASATIKSTPKADQSKAEEPQPDVSLNLQELYKTPARATRRSVAIISTPKLVAKPLPSADVSLNLQELYKTPARPTQSAVLASTSKSTPKAVAIADQSEGEEPQPDVSLNLKELYKTPARPTRSAAASATIKSTPTADQSKVEEPQPDVSLNLQELYKTPARATRHSTAVISTPKLVAESQPSADVSINLQELYKTPVRPTQSAVLASTSKSTPKAGAVADQSESEEPQPDVSLNLKELYKTPARPTRSAAAVATIKSTPEADQSKVEEPQPDVSLNLKELYKTPARPTRSAAPASTSKSTPKAVVAADQSEIEEPQPDVSLNLKELYKTPARATRHSTAVISTPKLIAEPQPSANVSINLQELYKTPARQTLSAALASTSKSTPKAVVVVDQSKDEEPQPDMSLNLKELYKTPARPTRSAAASATIKSTPKADQSKVEEPQPDVSLNLQELYKTPARPTRSAAASSSAIKSTPKADQSKVEPQADVSLNLQELYETPARSTQSASLATTSKCTPNAVVAADQSEVKPQPDVSLNLQELYKTPARPTRGAAASSTSKSTPKTDQSNVEEPQPGVSTKLQVLNKTPARSLGANTTVKYTGTPKEGVAEADASLNLQQLYKTPARPTRSAALASSSKCTPKVADLSKAEEPQPDMSLNLQELYKTPARTLRGVSQLTPVNASKVSTPVVEPVQREPAADMSLNLDQMYKTPARQLRGTVDISAVKHAKDSEVTPQKAIEKTATDVTPTGEPSMVQQRTPIASVSEAETNVTLNLEQMYKTPARQSSTEGKVEADASLNLDQLYKTPAHSLPGVTQLTSALVCTPTTEAKSEVEVSMNLQELYKTPARPLCGDTTQPPTTKESNHTPASTQQNTTAQTDDLNLNVESLFKTPARTTRARLPRSSAKATTDATPVAKTPLRTPRSANLVSDFKTTPTANNSIKDPSMVDSELASSNVVEESMDMGSESDGLATGKAISSTPFNPRTRKSTLVAAVGMMSPLNSTGDVTMTFTSEKHTEAIGITTIAESTAAESTTVDQMQTMAGVFVAAQSRLLYDETGSETTMLGDPLQVTNADEPLADTHVEETTCVEEVTATQQHETTQRTAVESLSEQNETLVKTPRTDRAATSDVPESADQSIVSTASAAEQVEESVQKHLTANTSPGLEKSNSSPARALRSSRSVAGTPINKSAVNTSVIEEAESDVEIINIPETPARVPHSEKSTPRNTPAAVVESKLSAVQSPIATPKRSVVELKSPAVQSPAASPNVLSSPASSAKKITSGTPKSTPARLSVASTTIESKPSSASKLRRSVAANISTNVQELSVVPDDTTETINEPSSPAVDSKLAENVSDHSGSVVPADDSTPEKSVTSLSIAESSAVAEKINDVTPELVSTTEKPTAAAPYLGANDSLGVDTALLQQIRDRVTTLERELEELDNVTHSSSTFLERSDDSQEVFEDEAKLEDKTPKPKKRQLYTKTAPDENTPERRESIGDHRATSSKHVYVETASSDKKADTSSEADDSKKMEQPVKVLPSRASRRKITTLSEEALAGASPELKFVKPKPPKVVSAEDTPPINTSANASETETSDQETSLGRRKVVFNDNIQVKEINSPAFVGEIIKRGRGRNTNQVVTVTVDQNLRQSIKPATKRGKPVEAEQVPAQGAVQATEDVSDKVEAVEVEHKPSRAGKSKTTSKKEKVPVASNDEEVAEDAKELDAQASEKQSEEIVEAPVDEPTAKRGRAKKAPAAKRTASRTKLEQQTSTSEEKADEPEVHTDKPSRHGAKVDAEVMEAVNEASDAEAKVEVEQKLDEPVAAEELSEQSEELVDEPAAKRSRGKKAPAAKRTGSRTKVEQQTSTSEEKIDEPVITAVKPTVKRSRRGAKVDAEIKEAANEATDAEVNVEMEQKIDELVAAEEIAEDAPESSEQSEETVEASVDEPAAKRSRVKKAPATKRTATRTKTEEQTATSEDKADEPETIVVKPTGKRPRRGVNASDVNETVAKEAEDEKKPAEVEQTVDEPISKRIRHAPETKTEQAVEKPVDGNEDQTKDAERTDEVQPATKAPSRSRRGKKQTTEVPAMTEDENAKTEATPVEAHEEASKTKEVKPRSRRGGKKDDTPTEEVVHTESTDDAPAEIKESTENTTEPAEEKTDEIKPKSRRDTKKQVETKAASTENDRSVENATIEAQVSLQTENNHEISEPKEETKSRSRRGGAKAKVTNKKADEVKNTPVETQNAEDVKQPESRRAAKKQPMEDESVAKESVVVSSSADSQDENSSSQSKPVVKKTNRRGRVNDTTESGDQPESSSATSSTLVVEKAVADSTSNDDPSTAEEVDVKSNTKRSRRGAKDEPESTVVKDEPTTKRTRRAPKSKTEQAHEEASPEATESVEVNEEPKSRSRRGQKQESVVVAETESSVTAVEKPSTKRTKQTAKKVEVEESQQESAVEQQEESKVEPSDVEEKPASRRGAKKAAEEQSSTRMPSPTLPPPAVEEQPAKRVGRQAAKRAPKKASNPDPAPVEMSMNESHMVKTMLPASHTSTPLIKTAANLEVPSATRGRGVVNPVIAALIEESTPSTRTRRGASATPNKQVETPSTPARRGRGRGAAAKAKAAEDETKEVVAEKVEPEVVEAEPVAKRARKVPAKLQDEADDDLGAKKAQPTRGRRGAKAKTEEPNDTKDETTEVSAGPSEEPKKKGRATSKRTVKKADLNEESVPAEEEEKAPKSPPPKRTRKGAR